MPETSSPRARREKEKAWFAIWLAWVAAFVDAAGYLILVRLALSHMSGNTIQIGLAASRAEWSTALVFLLPVPLFVGGVVLGALIQEMARRLGLRSTYAALFALEATLLLAFILCAPGMLAAGQGASGAGFFLLAALAAVAMGMQTATVHKVGGQPVRTTYMTGMLSDFAEAAASVIVAALDRLPAPRIHRGPAHGPRDAPGESSKSDVSNESDEYSGAEGDRQPSSQASAASNGQGSWTAVDRDAPRRMALLGALWLAYAFGAFAGAYTEVRWSAAALVLPLVSLACLIAVDLIWPTEAPPRAYPSRRPS